MVTAYALRSFKVRARSAREAQQKANKRAGNRAGPWTLDYPGELEEHFTVELDGVIMGPYGNDIFGDDDEDEDEE